MNQYIGDRIIERLGEKSMAEYRPEEFATIRGDAQELARVERHLRTTDLRRLYDWVSQLSLAVTCQGAAFAAIRDDFLMLYPMVAGSGARRGASGPAFSKGLQRVFFACLDAVERVPGGVPDPDRVRADNLIMFRRFLEALMQYRVYHGG